MLGSEGFTRLPFRGRVVEALTVPDIIRKPMADKRTFLQFIFFQLSIGSFQLSLFTLFFGAKKRGKRNIHPNPSFPYMGRLNRIPELARLPVAFPLVALSLR